MTDFADTDFFTSPEPEKRFFNLTPLIDMMFQLVTFLMLTTNLAVAHTLDISIVSTAETNAEAQPETPPSEDKTTFLRIESAGKVFVNDTEYNISGMMDEVKTRIAANPSQLVVLKAGEAAKIQDIVTVMDNLNVAGANNLSFSQD